LGGGFGFGGWGFGFGAQTPNPQSPIPNPQSPILLINLFKLFLIIYLLKLYYKNN